MAFPFGKTLWELLGLILLRFENRILFSEWSPNLDNLNDNFETEVLAAERRI